MWHILEFTRNKTLDVFVKGKHMEKVKVCVGERIQAQVKPYVIAGDLPIEMAELTVDDKTTYMAVPMGIFRFIDKEG